MSTVITISDQRVREADRFNLAGDSRTFDCKFIEPGIISYKDHQGGDIELLRKETIDRCIHTAIGNPITIGHVWVTSDNRLQEEQGIITDVYYDPVDGWYHVRGKVDTPRAQKLMKVKKPSCGYSVEKFGPAGTYHGIRYAKEIHDITFNHLAIVDNPRYEEAVFRLNSVSNPTNMNNVFKLLKRIVTRENGADGQAKETSKEESFDLPGNTEVTFTAQDKEHKMRLNDLGEMWMKQTAAAVTSRVNENDEVEVDGKKVRIHELVAGYRANRCHEAEMEAAKKKHENEAAEAKKKADEEAEAAKRKNENSFAQLHIARTAQSDAKPTLTSADSMQDKLARGKSRY